MTIDIVITTYNRPQKVVELVNSLSAFKEYVSKIIVVDSSEDKNESLNKAEIIYKLSTHKNQPFQRFLGAKLSSSDYILFLDDDMEIADNYFLQKISKILEKEELAGMCLAFQNKHENTILNKLPISKIKSSITIFTYLINIIKWLSGYPRPKEGEFLVCGVKGDQPKLGGYTQWVGGGAFIAKKELLFKNFNYQLFDIFEQRIGMGEDSIIGFSLCVKGKLYYHPEILFFHNDQRNSTYTPDLVSYGKRVAYSRLYLSLERARLLNKKLFIYTLKYHWYIIGRIIGMLINILIKPSKNKRELLHGTLLGWQKAFRFRFALNLERNDFWESELTNRTYFSDGRN